MADVTSSLRDIKPSQFSSEVARKEALAEARNLVNRLETPWETAFRYSWLHPARMACLKTAMDLGVFKKWVESGSQPKTEDELLKLVDKCDPQLFSRVICHLAGAQMLEVVKPGVFGLTPFTSALAEPTIVSTVDLYLQLNGPCMINLPKFLQENGYEDPSNQGNSNVTHTFGMPLWDWLKDKPQSEAMIGMVMSAQAANRPHFTEVYPVDNLLKHQQDDGVLLVDCGGGVGHDVAAFNKFHPQKPGKLVLQDRPAVIENAKDLDSAIEKMPYDFFTPQPVKGAAAYYFHFVLHDWPDADCKKILENVKGAMKKGYSKLLLHEVVLDPLKPEALPTASDITMMAMVSGQERTLKQWTTLMGETGFKINHIHEKPLASESVIEAEPL